MMVSLQAFLEYSHNVPSNIISAEKLLPYYSIRSEHIVPDSLELKLIVPKHIIPKIMELQSGVRQNLQNNLPSISLEIGVLTGVKSMDTDPSVCPSSASNTSSTPNNHRK